MPLSYTNPFVGTIADLMGVPARARAQALQQQGDAWAQAAQGVGRAAAGSMQDILRYKADEPRRQLQAQQIELEKSRVRSAQQDERDTQDIADAMRVSGGDPDMALTILRRRGAGSVNALGKLQSQVVQRRRAAVDDMTKNLDLTEKQLRASATLLQGVEEAGPEQKADAYAGVLPKIREMVGPELGKRLPDTYDPTIVKQALTWGETAQEHLQRRRFALEDAKNARDLAKDSREKDEHLTKALGGWLSTTSNDAEYQQVLKLARAPVTDGGYGADAITLAKFAPAWSPDAVKKAETFTLTAAEHNARLVRGGTKEEYVNTVEKDLGRPLTAQEQLNASRRWTYANRLETADPQKIDDRKRLVTAVLDDPEIWKNLTKTQQSAIAADLHEQGFTGFDIENVATKATAERWRQDQFTRIKKEFKESQLNPAGDQRMTPEERDAQMLEVENSYRAQIGDKPTDRVPGSKPQAPKRDQFGDIALPNAAPPKAAPPKKATSVPVAIHPDDAAAIKKAGKPGVYKLNDGTRWILNADGTIVPASAAR